MTEAEKRKHIKPYLRFCILYLKRESINTGLDFPGLCGLVCSYINTLDDFIGIYELELYLKERLKFARPKDSWAKGWKKKDDGEFWWGLGSTYTLEGLKKRIAFCELQLKIVK